MSLILVVEPDRRQAAHLTHVVRQRVGAELILAETTELALASIGNRVPDLILVPALLSPQDDAALAAALRVIATAAHVQMLTTPLFASAPPEPRRGVLSAFRRAKPAKASIDGCDPAEFAQQISSYLESAAEERAAAAQYAEAPAQIQAPVVETPQPYAPLEAGRLYRDEVLAHREIEATPVTEAVSEAAITLPEAEPVAQYEPIVPFEAAQLLEDIALIPEAVATVKEPILEIPDPILEAPEPILEASEPILEEPEPILEEPEPLIETPEPLAATESTRSRRIGFVMHEETEPELAPALEEPFIVEPDRVEIAASVEAAFTIEAPEEQEPVGVFSEPVAEETLELLEVVDDVQDAVGAIDLSADFEDLQVVEAQSDVEAIEIATDETDVLEVLETPEMVEAVQPAAPQLHAIGVDALKEFAASVEAMTAVEPIAVAAGDAAAAEALEFEDLFPRREPVEPSPLGAWHSWVALEGMAAETSDAPVPAHVVERATERAVERAPERPEWVQLVESLRIDVERRRSEQPAVAAKPVRITPSRPVQDEWGLFDPAQCGFAALLSKLDEITDASESRPRRSA
jgi:hypothetical protein